MKNMISLFCAVTLVACGGGGGGDSSQPPDFGTAPRLDALRLSRDHAFVREGDGMAIISAEIDYTDPERDLAHVHVVVSDGTELDIPVPGPVPAATGTLIGDLSISTAAMGDFTAEVWIEDAAGNDSNHISVEFSIVIDPNTWLERLADFEHWINGVAWNGSIFVAVGNGGSILTSTDGVVWAVQASPVTTRLNDVEWLGSQFFAVGDAAAVLTSPDGVNWTLAHTGPSEYWLQGVSSSGDIFVAGGGVQGHYRPYLMTSIDGVTWTEQQNMPQTGRSISDIAWSGQIFVATAMAELFPNDGRILTSVDGQSWTEIVISNTSPSTLSIIWSGDRFIAGGVVGHIYMSSDGINWTDFDTSTSTNFISVAASPHEIIAAGNGRGVMTRDNGENWDIIFVGSFFTTRGIAQGADRYIAVGVAGEGFGQGWIYTTR